MLQELRIQGSAVIDDTELELGPGLTVLTGETGTGKTTVLTALSLLMGGKPPPNAAYRDAAALAVDGLWSMVPASVLSRADAAGGSADDDGSLVARRTVGAQGRSRAFVGGAAVPAAVLAEIGDELAAVHGQSDQLLLRRSSLQRDVLDRFAGAAHVEAVAAHGRLWREATEVRERLDELISRGDERRRARDEAAIGVDLIDQLDPRPGEDVELKKEAMRLQNIDALHEAAASAVQALVGADSDDPHQGDASSAIAVARRALSSASQHDPSLEAVQLRLDEISVLADDLASELRAYVDSLDAEPDRLEQVQQRRGRLSEIARRFGGASASFDEALRWRERARVLLGEPDDRVQVDRLNQDLADLQVRLRDSAGGLTAARRSAGGRLGAIVTDELQALAMPRSRFEVQVGEATDGAFGADDIVFALVPRTGSEPVPLHKGASGGELSRVMLALEVVLAGADPVGTFVFDEVDAGVGGRAAVDVGRRLALLGGSSQVIVVTHLPQVAAFADHHFLVHRDEGSERASIRALDDESRVTELTRMLAGLEDSQAGRAHAEELLATASSLKKSSVKKRSGS